MAEMAELEPWGDEDFADDAARGKPRTAASLAEDSPWREPPPSRGRENGGSAQARPRYEAPPRETGEFPAQRRNSAEGDGSKQRHFTTPMDTGRFQALMRTRARRARTQPPTTQPPPSGFQPPATEIQPARREKAIPPTRRERRRPVRATPRAPESEPRKITPPAGRGAVKAPSAPPARPFQPPPPSPTTDAHSLRVRAADVRRRATHYAADTWSQRRPWVIVGALTIIGLVVRLVFMRSIWVDEAISIHQAHLSLGAMLDNLRTTDRHPPLHYLILWVTERLLGDGELAVRGPSILASSALIPVLFITGRELFDRRTGLVAAALATFAPLVIWYGQEARMYALFMLLATLALWAQVRVLRDGRSRYWVIYGAVNIALLYTHYFAVIPIAIQQVVFAVAAWKRARAGYPVRRLLTGYWLTWLALVVAAAPLAPFAYDQFHNSQAVGMGFGGTANAVAATTAGSSVSFYAVLSNFVWAIWGYHANSTMLQIAALWPLLMLVSLALMGQRRSPGTRVVLALAFGPVILLLLVGLVKRDLFEIRYFIGVVPMILLLLARSVAGGARRRMPALVATLGLGLTLLLGLADQQLNPNNPRNFDFRDAMASIRSQVRPGDTVLYGPDYLRDVVAYYSPGVNVQPLSEAQMRNQWPTTGRVFLLASFLDDPTTAQQVGAARYQLGQGRRLVRTDDQKRIHIWEYS